LLTWGTTQRCTWRWLRSRLMEVHGLAWRQLMPAGGRAPGGEDWDALVAANADYLEGGLRTGRALPEPGKGPGPCIPFVS
ncbi:hypothetical protein JUN65_12495, partial [Gluconacetobacter azotocaptans]|nr:hypothetical protein [Gluconacetobacter azotocaptans]